MEISFLCRRSFIFCTWQYFIYIFHTFYLNYHCLVVHLLILFVHNPTSDFFFYFVVCFQGELI